VLPIVGSADVAHVTRPACQAARPASPEDCSGPAGACPMAGPSRPPEPATRRRGLALALTEQMPFALPSGDLWPCSQASIRGDDEREPRGLAHREEGSTRNDKPTCCSNR
jgi:hypothetical protein